VVVAFEVTRSLLVNADDAVTVLFLKGCLCFLMGLRRARKEQLWTNLIAV